MNKLFFVNLNVTEGAKGYPDQNTFYSQLICVVSRKYLVGNIHFKFDVLA